MTSDLGDRGELEDSWKEKSSPRITSNQPPWIEMVYIPNVQKLIKTVGLIDC